jgi:hypothetical protein
MTIQCALGYVNAATLTCCGETATAAQAKDNLNELLNMLHIGGLNAGARTPSGPPTHRSARRVYSKKST